MFCNLMLLVLNAARYCFMEGHQGTPSNSLYLQFIVFLLESSALGILLTFAPF